MKFTDALQNVMDIQQRTMFPHQAKKTSIEAALSVHPKLTEKAIEVLEYAYDMGYQGFTDIDLSRQFDCQTSTYRSVRSRLEDLHFIAMTNRTVRYPERGNNCFHTVFIHKDFVR